jgi:hypothetical protein
MRGGNFRHTRTVLRPVCRVLIEPKARLGVSKSRTVLGVTNQAPPPTASPDFRVNQRSQAAGSLEPVHDLITSSEQRISQRNSDKPIEARINQSPIGSIVGGPWSRIRMWKMVGG